MQEILDITALFQLVRVGQPVISDHSDWNGLTAVIAATGAGQVWVTHGAEEALVHWCLTHGLRAQPLHLVGYSDEEEGEATGATGAPATPLNSNLNDADETTGGTAADDMNAVVLSGAAANGRLR